MADFGVVITDLSGTARAFLDVYGLKLTRRINGACQLEFSAPTDDVKARELLIGKRAVKLYRDGALVFMGVIGEPFVDEADFVRIVAYDPFFYLAGAFVGGVSGFGASYTSFDAGAMAWDLISGLGYETHLELGTLETSVDRDRTYEPGKSIAEAIKQLSEVEGGFFFRIDAEDSAGATFGTFNVLYPDAGTDRPGVRFEYGDGTLSNIEADGLEVERFSPVNLVVVKGSGQGDTVPTATAQDAASQTEYGTWPKYVEVSDVLEETTLQEHADAELKTDPPVAVSFSATTEAPALFDAFDVGDTVRVKINNGRTAVEGSVRVNQVTLEVDDATGAEHLTGLVLESPTLQAQEVM